MRSKARGRTAVPSAGIQTSGQRSERSPPASTKQSAASKPSARPAPIETGSTRPPIRKSITTSSSPRTAARAVRSWPAAVGIRRAATRAPPPASVRSGAPFSGATGSQSRPSPLSPSARPKSGASTGSDRAAQTSPASGPLPATRQCNSSMRVADQRTATVPAAPAGRTCAGASPHHACTSPRRSARAIQVPGAAPTIASRVALKRDWRRTAMPPPSIERATSGSPASAAARRWRSAATSRRAARSDSGGVALCAVRGLPIQPSSQSSSGDGEQEGGEVEALSHGHAVTCAIRETAGPLPALAPPGRLPRNPRPRAA